MFLFSDKTKAIERGEELVHLQQKCKLINLQTMHMKEVMEKAGVGFIDLSGARKKLLVDASQIGNFIMCTVS